MPITTPRRRRTAGVVATLAATGLLAGCITGERPTLEPEVEVNDPAVEAVLERLGRAETGSFTAQYAITPTVAGAAVTTATVRRLDNGRTKVTIGSIDYLIDGSVTRTCEDDECVDRIDDARVSDLGITNRFWGNSFEARLRIDAARDLSFGRGRIDTIAGRPAACVDVVVVGGTVVYCALDVGVLARYVGADVTIELTSFAFGADEAEFGI